MRVIQRRLAWETIIRSISSSVLVFSIASVPVLNRLFGGRTVKIYRPTDVVHEIRDWERWAQVYVEWHDTTFGHEEEGAVH